MDLTIYRPIIQISGPGEVIELSPEEIRSQFHHTVLNAFLDNDEVSNITIRERGSSFCPVTYSKLFVDPEWEKMRKLGGVFTKCLGW